VLALAFVAAWIFNADREADLVKQGIGISGFPSIAWRTERVTVVSLASTPPAAIEKLQESCLMHLGQANGVTVMYDVTKKGVLRLPTSSIMLRTESSPCRAASVLRRVSLRNPVQPIKLHQLRAPGGKSNARHLFPLGYRSATNRVPERGRVAQAFLFQLQNALRLATDPEWASAKEHSARVSLADIKRPLTALGV
jgi:hypothetical protein